MEGVKTTTNTLTATPAAENDIPGAKAQLKESSDLSKSPALPGLLQPKLTIGSPDDMYEKEADSMADKVMRMPEPVNFSNGNDAIQRKCAHCENEEMQIHRKEQGNDSMHSVPSIVQDVINSSPGKPLDESARSFMEPRFDFDFSNVKIHDNDLAAKSAGAINALAYTSGNNVVFNSGQYNTNSENGKRLLAHELTHVIQQGNSSHTVSAKTGGQIKTDPTENSVLRRSLILTGDQTNIDSFIAMSETASGLVLSRDPATSLVTAVGSSATPGTSPAYERHLAAIMNDPVQNAEINVGTNQPRVDIGAFPTPADLSGNRFQNVDMDDINAMEAGAPGIGVADLIHEIVENFDAHSTPGVNSFDRAHAAGLQAESEVVTDIVGSGNRVAQADVRVGNITSVAEDYDVYYVLSTITATPATQSFTRSNVSFAPKVLVRAHTANNFATGSNLVPATAAADMAATVADLVANPMGTVRIEGFTDDVGSAATNLRIGRERAEAAANDLIAAGINGSRIQIIGRGETSFVAPNNTDANRGLNRRVVLTVNRPGP